MRLLPFLPLFAITAALAAEPPVPQFRAVTLDDQIQIGYGLAIADVDGDQRPDILLADKKQIVWYRNPGKAKAGDAAAWTKHLIAENLTEKDNVCLAAQDIDGDGKCELAVGGQWNPSDTENSGAVFYLIAPADRTQRWTPVKLHHEPTVHRMRWIKLGEGKWGLVVAPLHGRGNKNGEGAGVRVLLYHPPPALLLGGRASPRAEAPNDNSAAREDARPPGAPAAPDAAAASGEWKTELIDDSMHMTHNFEVVESNVRPTSDLYLCGKEGVRWLMKEGQKWEGREVASNLSNLKNPAGEIAQVSLRDPAGMLRHPPRFVVTVEPMHGASLVIRRWRYNDPPGGPDVVTLTDRLTEGHALKSGRLLGTPADQIVVGWRGKPGAAASTTGLAVWTSLDAQGEKWRETVIDPDGMACEDVQLADLDGDGRLDIVAAGRATKNVKVYFNTTPAR